MDNNQVIKTNFTKWVMLPFAILTFGVGLGLPVSLSIMFLDWQETFQVSRAHTAAVHSTCVGFLLGGSIIPGYIMKKIGARLTILIGSVLASIGFVLSMFATSIEYLIVTTGVMGGLGCCFIQMSTIPCITAVFDKYLSLIISTCTISSAIFVVLFPNVYDFLVDEYSWRGSFGIFGCIILNTCVSGMIITSVSFRKPSFILNIEESACSFINNHDETNRNNETNEENITLSLSQKDKMCDDIEDSQNDKHSNTVMTLLDKKDQVSKISSMKELYETSQVVRQKNSRNIRERIKNSEWKFLVDIVFVLLFFHNTFCLASIFCFPLLITDFSKSRGFDKSSGILFFTIIFIASIFGRLFVGLLNLHPRFHSITLYTSFSIVNMMVMILMSFIRNYNFTIICLSLYGICLGAVIALQMKCVLDIQSVDLKSFPLALGLVVTSEGIADFFIPILIGYSVDKTGSYTFILILMGCIGLVFSILLAAGFWLFGGIPKKQEKLSAKLDVSEYKEGN